MKKLRKAAAILLTAVIMLTAGIFCTDNIKANAASSTGVGLSEFVLTAYYENWSYVYGAMSYGCVDCSGLIMLYNGVGGSRTSMCYVASVKGYMDTLPRIHGLGLWQPGHVGVYVGGGMAVDARDEYSGVCYQSVYTKNWTMWFKVVGVSYPTTGWETFNGNKYYYEDGEYLANTTRTIDGVTYTFGAAGTIISAVDAGGEDVDVSDSTGNNTVYEEATQGGSISYPSYDYSAAQEAARQEAERQEAERQRLEEEERKRKEEEERLAAEKRLSEAKSASALSYLTTMASADPFVEEEPETVAISADANTILLKDEKTDGDTASKTEENVVSETTVVMQQALDNGDVVVNTSQNSSPRHPLMFLGVIFSAFAAAALMILLGSKLQAKKKSAASK